MNRTVTVQGHEFYRYFSMWWHHNPDASNYSISIHERPSARWGSEIWVDYHHTRIFHMFLPPTRSRTKEISREAAASASSKIMDEQGNFIPDTLETQNFTISVADAGGGFLQITTTDRFTGAATTFQVSKR